MKSDTAKIIGAALLVRLVMLLLFDPFDSILLGDASTFINPTPGYQPPFYPFLVAIFGWKAMPFLQSALTVGVAIFTARRLPRHGFAVGMAIACLPFLIIYEWKILTEGVFISLLWLAFLFLAFPKHALDRIAGGLLLALVILTRDTFLFLPLFMIPFAGREWKQVGKAAIVAYIAVIPFMPISQGRVGINLWIGTWERNVDWLKNGIRAAEFPDYAYTSAAQKPIIVEAVRRGNDKVLRDAAINRYTNDPGFVLTSWAVRYPRLWIGTRTDQATLRIPTGTIGWYMVKLAAGGLGLLIIAFGLWGARRGPLLWAAPAAYTALIYIPFHNAEPRYSLPALVFLLGFAVVATASQLRRRRFGLEQSPTAADRG